MLSTYTVSYTGPYAGLGIGGYKMVVREARQKKFLDLIIHRGMV